MPAPLAATSDEQTTSSNDTGDRADSLFLLHCQLSSFNKKLPHIFEKLYFHY